MPKTLQDRGHQEGFGTGGGRYISIEMRRACSVRFELPQGINSDILKRLQLNRDYVDTNDIKESVAVHKVGHSLYNAADSDAYGGGFGCCRIGCRVFEKLNALTEKHLRFQISPLPHF